MVYLWIKYYFADRFVICKKGSVNLYGAHHGILVVYKIVGKGNNWMKILVAVIAYNEELSIANTLRDLHENNFGFDVVVIDDGSTDKTFEICREAGFPVLRHCINSGSFGAVKTYFLYAYLNGYDVLCQFDGDGQHVASELPKTLLPIQKNEADYVIGSRFIDNQGFQSSTLRRVGVRLFSSLNSKIIGQRISDSTSGFRAYNRKMIELFSKTYRHEIHDTIQLLLLAHYNDGRIVEVPVTMRPRKYGESEYTAIRSVGFVMKGLVNTLGSILQRKQFH